MARLKCPLVLISLILSTYHLSANAQLAQRKRTIRDTKLSDEEKLLDCGELTDLTSISLCLVKRFTEVKSRTSSSGYGYPYQIAPTLPPFLVADSPPNNIATHTKRKQDVRQTRIQGYREPQYRNFLDMDTTLRPRIAEYRPVFDGYVVPVLVHQAEGVTYKKPSKSVYYAKQGKADAPSGRYSRKHTKGYGYRLNNPPTRYSSGTERKYDDEPKKEYVKQNYNSAYTRVVQHSKSSNYDRDYYVPANSPIIGDIRRSLMDFTGADDLMVDEPEYVIRSHRIKEMGNDYYPFDRRSYVRDLEVNESKKKRSRTGN